MLVAIILTTHLRTTHIVFSFSPLIYVGSVFFTRFLVSFVEASYKFTAASPLSSFFSLSQHLAYLQPVIILALIVYVKLHHETSYYNDETYLLWINYDNLLNELCQYSLCLYLHMVLELS